MRRFCRVIVVVILASLHPVVGSAQAGLSCDGFEFQEAAQIVLSERNADVLDPDGDGIACEELPKRGGLESSRDDDDAESGSRDSSGDAITSIERRYIDDLNEGLLDLGNASTELGELFTDASDDPSKFLEMSWKASVAANIAEIQQVEVAANTLSPSDRQEHLHTLWLRITELTTAATNDYAAGIDNLEPTLVEQGTDRYTYAGLLVGDLVDARDAFLDDPDDPLSPDHAIGPVQECGEFASYQDAQVYYAAFPEEAETIDPDGDKLACEVFFGEG